MYGNDILYKCLNTHHQQSDNWLIHSLMIYIIYSLTEKGINIVLLKTKVYLHMPTLKQLVLSENNLFSASDLVFYTLSFVI
jgi:hypothetical protein